jgi:hypothetical protein
MSIPAQHAASLPKEISLPRGRSSGRRGLNRRRMSVRLRRGVVAPLMGALLAALLAGCAFHSGSDALAFLRDGQLWTIQGDGANPHQVASGGIVSYGWSPDHRQFAYRTASPFPASQRQSPIQNAPDLSGNLYVTSINGGSAIPITPDASSLVRSDAWWNPDGNRLLYIQRFPTSGDLGDEAEYVVSQDDQPVGIASKSIPDAATLPSVSSDGARVATINANGDLLVGAAGTRGKLVAGGALLQLPNTSRPARVLWRPHTGDLLYATLAENSSVQLTLHEAGGATRPLGLATGMLDAAFSPDGAWLLVRTTEQFRLWDMNNPGIARYEWSNVDQTAIPYWSPDSKRLLVFDTTGALVVDLAAKANQTPLTYAQPRVPSLGPPPHWRPAPGGQWSPDGKSVVFVGAAGDSWNGAQLTTTGLYVASVDGVHTGNARLVDSGADEAPLWSYLDPSASFLLPS